MKIASWGVKLRLVPMLVCVGLLTSYAGAANAVGFSSGDILVALTNGTVQVRSSDGTLKTTLSAGTQGPAKGLALNAEGELYVSFWLGSNPQSGNIIGTFQPNGTFSGTFGGPYNCNPSGIVIDKDGNVYVGQADCSGDILKFNSAGTLLDSFDVKIESRGARWLDLSPNGCTMFYTSNGFNVNQYNVCSETQLPDLNTTPFPDGSQALGLRALPGGGVIVAVTTHIVRLDSNGTAVGTYDAVGENGLVSVFLDPDGKSFWSGSYTTGNVYKFDIQTGAILMSFDTAAGDATAKGVLVIPPREEEPPPPQGDAIGRMTGGGNFYSSEDVVVHHGFQLRCNASDHRQNLEINWGKGQKFHLETVTTVSCKDDPAIDPEQPDAPIDTLMLTGSGRLQGKETGTIELTFTDAGEPGVNDGVALIIRDSDGNIVLNVPATTLIHGNHQAHRATGN